MLRHFQALGADLGALFAVEDVMLGGLDDSRARISSGLDDVLDAFNSRHEVRELPLDAESSAKT